MIPYCSFLALMSGNSPLSALQFHLPSRYLGSGALSYLKDAVWSWNLDLVISHKEVVCSSCSGRWAADLTAFGLKSGRSLGDLSFCGPVRYLVRFYVIMCLSCHFQVKRRTTRAKTKFISNLKNSNPKVGIFIKKKKVYSLSFISLKTKII